MILVHEVVYERGIDMNLSFFLIFLLNEMNVDSKVVGQITYPRT